jgi:hypothetical protein
VAAGDGLAGRRAVLREHGERVDELAKGGATAEVLDGLLASMRQVHARIVARLASDEEA